MRRIISRMFLAGLGLTLSTLVSGQGAYSPGQTFSSGASSRTPAPANPPYQAPRPVTTPSVRQQPAPASASTPERSSSTGSTSLYNLPSQASSESAKPKASSQSATREKKNTPVQKPAETKTTVKAEETKKPAATSTPAKEKEPVAKAAPVDTPEIASAVESADKLVIFSRKTGKKQIALTYDDGPSPSLTPKLTAYLKENNVPATFFVLGEMVKAHPAMTKALADDGFELANHTYSHPDLRKLSEEKIQEQLQDTHDLIKEASGVDVKYMRPPFGAHNSKVDAVCKKMGYKIINWSIDTNDWRKRPTAELVNTIMNGASDGAIILMHDRTHGGKETVLEATKQVVSQLRAKGYTFVTVGELLDETGSSVAAAPAVSPASVQATSGTSVIPAPAVVPPVMDILPATAQDPLPAPSDMP